MKYFSFLLTALSLFGVQILSAQCLDTLDLGPDTIICDPGGSYTLQAPSGYIEYDWSTGDTSTSITFNQSGQYWLDVWLLDSMNLVFNGNFNFGSLNFTSQYIVGTGGSWGLLSSEGTYVISTNASLTHNNFANCSDHTSGTGNMLVVNGSNTVGQHVWCSDVATVPGDDYIFSAWFTSVHPSNPAELSFTINGTNIGNNVNLSSTTCQWQQFYELWNAGTTTIATICITNQNVGTSGNDFALDDIYFARICRDVDTVNVLFSQNAVVDLGPDQEVCAGDSVVLDAGNPGANYLWSDGSTQQTLTAKTTGIYWVTADFNGCLHSDTFELVVHDYPFVDLGADTSLCDGEEIILDAYWAGATAYQWMDGSSDSVFLVNSAGNYSVTVDNHGCSSSDQISIDYIELPYVELGPSDTLLCEGLSLDLNAFIGNQFDYLWSNQSTNAQISTNEEGLIWVEVSNQCLTVSDSMLLSYENCDCNVYFPNAFTPNNDGVNDVFTGVLDCDWTDWKLMIFDRWGELVFVSEHPDEGWRGYIKGVPAPQGVYTWRLNLEADTGGKEYRFTKSGTVTLLPY